MKHLRNVLLFLVALALGLALLIPVVHLGKLDASAIIRSLQSVSALAFAKLVSLNCLLVALSTAKWRLVDAAVRTRDDSVPSYASSFAMTSCGMALGLVLPVQMGMATARTMGIYFYGRPIKRGTGATILEQSFDLLLVVLLGVASIFTWLRHGGALLWWSTAALMVLLAWVTASHLSRFLAALASRFAALLRIPEKIRSATQSFASFATADSHLTSLVRKLLLLSSLRFLVVVLMAEQAAIAIGVHIPLWHMAAAIPFVVVALLIAITPGALGLNELTSLTALTTFGTSASTAAQWAIGNRILSTASCLLVAILAAAGFGLVRLIANLGKPRSEPVNQAERAIV